MLTKPRNLKIGAHFGIGLLVLFVLYLMSYYNYLLYHSIAELFSITIAFSIFIIGWNSRKYMNNMYFLFLGIVYLFVGLLDLIHTLSYSGMGVFLGFNSNLPTQLWIAVRYLEALSLLAAIVLIIRKFSYRFLFLLYSIIFILIIGAIFYWRIFPTTYIEGEGLTLFKISSEYLINVILFISILVMIQRRTLFEKQIFVYLIISTIFTILAEMAFTFYVSVFGFSNFVGHIFKIISFYLVYKAIIETGLKKPYNLIFRDLKLREAELLKYHTQLENLVEERTKKLKKSEEKYRKAYHRADFYKDLFSHDINNILQSMLSGMELCEIELDNPDEVKKNIKIMRTEIIRGAKIDSNIRKLSQLEETEMSLKRIGVCSLLKKSIDYVKETYQDTKIAININSVSKQLYVQANELIRDIFENILINAVRHNKSSIPEINVRIYKEQIEGVPYLKIEFLDNGVGVGNTRKEKIFQRGYSKYSSVHGIGLGLSLVKKIIDNYNGQIWVEDKVNGDHSKGSNFVLLIPEVN